ncbi:MAG: VWA domain-containing protein [Sandaracinaceae bacterium]|nr:VWA domain-containing protein [Sandaracinaceae bacterium]
MRGGLVRGRAIIAAVLVAALAGCGSKSPLYVPHYEADGGTDGGRDAGRDGGRDAGTDAGPEPDECIELPYLEPPRELEISFFAQILSADVFFLVDVTGSMGEEIDQIRSRLREEIIPGLASAIPDVRFGVGHFADFPPPTLNYGEEDDDLFVLLAPQTSNVTLVQNAVDRLPLQGGRDGPEALVEALYLTATGEGMGRFVRPATCPADTVGYPCFRGVGSRIILAFTDAPSHNGPGGHDAYSGISPPPHTYEVTANALRMIGAKVLGLYSGGPGGGGEADLVALARDTGAIRGDGRPSSSTSAAPGARSGPRSSRRSARSSRRCRSTSTWSSRTWRETRSTRWPSCAAWWPTARSRRTARPSSATASWTCARARGSSSASSWRTT